MGAFDFLEKPIALDLLEHTVRRALSTQRIELEHKRTLEELEHRNKELMETNAALSVLTRNIERTRQETEKLIILQVRSLIVPLLEDMKLERAKSQLKEDAFGMLAHDLRSPLLMVVRFMGLSMQGLYGPLTSEQHQLFSELKDHCDLLLGLMNDILDVRSYEAGTLVLRKTVTEIPKLIHQSVRLLQFAIADQDIRIETHFGSDVSSLVVDEKRIMRVLINLLDNAIRFSPSGEKVVLQCSRLATGEVLITVNDAGSGIHQENQQHIFDKFYPVGTGLGLAFCRETVQAHGGRIWVESPLNERSAGSRFCFTLPCGATREGIGCSEVAGNS
jgi:signal transduction histidine kinase